MMDELLAVVLSSTTTSSAQVVVCSVALPQVVLRWCATVHPKLLTITWWCAKIRISPSLSASPPASIIDFVIESIGPGWTKPPQQQNLNQNDRSNFYCWTCSLCAGQALNEDRILEFLRVSLSLYCWIVDQSIIAVVVKQNRFQKGQLFAHLLGLQITSWSNSY